VNPIDRVAVAARAAALRARIGPGVELLAVTKGFGPEALDAAASAGCPMVGENYAQELLGKVPTMRRLGLDVHFIGRLQTNKVRVLAPVVDVWESVDRARLVDEIARRCPGATVLVQVNATGEADKGGVAPADAATLVARAADRGLRVQGLMTVGPTNGDRDVTRRAFDDVAALADRLGLAVRSMGMSGDLDLALKAGTTRVRVGTALFGARPHPL
jgi:PLP dependent protein